MRKNIDSDEWLDLLCYLSYLLDANLISHPIVIDKRESPDYKLSLINGRTIGIEHTRATTENSKHADSKAKAEPGQLIELPYLWDKEHSNEIVNNSIKNRGEELDHPGYGDDGEEKAWVECVLSTISKKLKKDYSGFDSTELIVFDDSPAFFRRYEDTAPRLKKELIKLQECKHFDKIHIFDDHKLIYDVLDLCKVITSQRDFKICE